MYRLIENTFFDQRNIFVEAESKSGSNDQNQTVIHISVALRLRLLVKTMSTVFRPPSIQYVQYIGLMDLRKILPITHHFLRSVQ